MNPNTHGKGAYIQIQVLTRPQQNILYEVEDFILSHRENKSNGRSNTEVDAEPPALRMPNTFPARERAFIGKLAEDLNLDITWDEYDEDQNLVVWRFPASSLHGQDAQTADDNEDWEDVDSEEDEEAQAAVDRVLQKYLKAKVMDDDEEDFDTRHERGIHQKMDEWKRHYYKVRVPCYLKWV